MPFYVSADTYDKSKCDIRETDENVINKLQEQGSYKKNQTGIVCFNIKGLSVIFPIKNGKKEGIGKAYYESGALKQEASFKNGKKDGTEKSYYESGALHVEILYKNDKREGIGKEYYENGALRQEKPYKNNKIEGIEKVYYESGKLVANITYQNSKVIKGICANGRKWTNAEINNWEKGLGVTCGR